MAKCRQYSSVNDVVRFDCCLDAAVPLNIRLMRFSVPPCQTAREIAGLDFPNVRDAAL